MLVSARIEMLVINMQIYNLPLGAILVVQVIAIVLTLGGSCFYMLLQLLHVMGVLFVC